MEDKKYGQIQIHLLERIANKGISKNKLANKAEISLGQLNKYCNGSIQRLDMAILSRLCYVLECSISELLEYVPPEEK